MVELVQEVSEGGMLAPYSNVWVSRATARHAEIATLKELSDKTGMSGYDDCRPTDLLLRAHHFGLLNEARTVTELERLGEAVIPFYGSWSVYLASCAVGRIADWQGRHEIMPTVGRTLGAIQRLAANPDFLAASAPFWPLGDLRRVAELLLPLVPIEECRPSRSDRPRGAPTCLPLSSPSCDCGALGLPCPAWSHPRHAHPPGGDSTRPASSPRCPDLRSSDRVRRFVLLARPCGRPLPGPLPPYAPRSGTMAP